MTSILIVDDKEMMRDSVATTLARKGHSVAAAAGGKAALARIAERTPDVVITDLEMPEMSGLDLLARIRKHDEQLPVIFITAYGTIETAVTAMKNGAFDYITKPFSGEELLVAVDRALEHARLLKENQILKATVRTPGRNTPSPHPMIGSGEKMAALRQRLAMIADSHGTALITGDSGTGKEVAAHWIHEHSPRAANPFLAINCVALSTSLLESELFGHEKGAFTGADKLRKGRFELANGGTLLLDEISEISPNIQAKLLRVLQERTFERVGSSTSRAVDVRVIATSNRNLQQEVAKGSFREDLYFRLNVLPLEMPLLRDRKEDIEELTKYFLKQVAKREGRPVKHASRDVIESLCNYSWPGNVRELQNICERAAVLTTSDRIHCALIQPWLSSGRISMQSVVESKAIPEAVKEQSRLLPDQLICNGDFTLEIIEREAILATLEQYNGHRQKSAAALGIGVRTLGLKLKKWKEMQIISASV